MSEKTDTTNREEQDSYVDAIMHHNERGTKKEKKEEVVDVLERIGKRPESIDQSLDVLDRKYQSPIIDADAEQAKKADAELLKPGEYQSPIIDADAEQAKEDGEWAENQAIADREQAEIEAETQAQIEAEAQAAEEEQND